MRNRLLRLLAALPLLALVEGGGGLFEVCRMEGKTRMGCSCVHTEEAAPCALLRASCCELRNLPMRSGALEATTQSGSRDTLATLPSVPPTPFTGAAAMRGWLAHEQHASARAGPPIFLRVCSYLI